MPIKQLQCPQCGNEVEMGLPKDSVVQSVTTGERPGAGDPRQKVRSVRCGNDHEVLVLFEW